MVFPFLVNETILLFQFNSYPRIIQLHKYVGENITLPFTTKHNGYGSTPHASISFRFYWNKIQKFCGECKMRLPADAVRAASVRCYDKKSLVFVEDSVIFLTD
jgi:hypothetical protein